MSTGMNSGTGAGLPPLPPELSSTGSGLSSSGSSGRNSVASNQVQPVGGGVHGVGNTTSTSSFNSVPGTVATVGRAFATNTPSLAHSASSSRLRNIQGNNNNNNTASTTPPQQQSMGVQYATAATATMAVGMTSTDGTSVGLNMTNTGTTGGAGALSHKSAVPSAVTEMRNLVFKAYELEREDFNAMLTPEQANRITSPFFVRTASVVGLQAGIPVTYFKNSIRGVKLYISGDFEEAKKCFEAAVAVYPNGKSHKPILDFMQECKFKAPANWQGFRQLES